MFESRNDRIDRMIRERGTLLESMRESVRREARRHAAEGLLMSAWRDGQVVWIDPLTHQEAPPEAIVAMGPS